MKDTALTQLHIETGARMVEFAGYRMPIEYSGVTNEHLAVRNTAGIFDVSHMGEFWVTGEGSLKLLQYTTTNDLTVLKNGQAQYNCFPNGKGGIVDDLIIYKYEDQKYMLVVNASNIQKDWEWLLANNSFSAKLNNASYRTSLIALQGPRAIDILQPVVPINLKDLKSFTFVVNTVAGIPNTTVSATGYTGSGGYEIYCSNETAVKIWKSLVQEGKKFGLQPAGLAARDTLRLEMGYNLYGNDIDDTTSPIEAGLGWIVKLNHTRKFIDCDLIEKQIKEGTQRRLIGFELIERGIPRKDYLLFNSQDKEIGRVTSGTMSPSLQKGIGIGYVTTDQSFFGNEIFVQVRNKKLKARVVKFPFK